MTTELTGTNTGKPAPSSAQATPAKTPFSRRVLKLEHPANVLPLMHIVGWAGVLAFGLLVPAAARAGPGHHRR